MATGEVFRTRYMITVPTGHYETKDEPEIGASSRSWVNDAPETWEIEATINVESIVRWIGARAVQNKNGVAKYLSGDIVVKRLRKITKESA